MAEPIVIPAPKTYDLDGGSSLEATVAKVGDLFVIAVDYRDAFNLKVSLRPRNLGPRGSDNREAIEKLAELLEKELGK